MKKIEVKEIGITSVFKVILYISVIPILFMLIISLLIGNITAFLPLILMPIWAGLLYMLIAFFYNIFSKKFGGLTLMVEEKNEQPIEDIEA